MFFFCSASCHQQRRLQQSVNKSCKDVKTRTPLGVGKTRHSRG